MRRVNLGRLILSDTNELVILTILKPDLVRLSRNESAAYSSRHSNPSLRLFQRPNPVPICCECLGPHTCNPAGEAESLISCFGCGTSVHPSCRVYSRDLVDHFNEQGWTCDDCKTCLVCGETQKNVSI